MTDYIDFFITMYIMFMFFGGGLMLCTIGYVFYCKVIKGSRKTISQILSDL